MNHECGVLLIVLDDSALGLDGEEHERGPWNAVLLDRGRPTDRRVAGGPEGSEPTPCTCSVCVEVPQELVCGRLDVVRSGFRPELKPEGLEMPTSNQKWTLSLPGVA